VTGPRGRTGVRGDYTYTLTHIDIHIHIHLHTYIYTHTGGGGGPGPRGGLGPRGLHEQRSMSAEQRRVAVQGANSNPITLILSL